MCQYRSNKCQTESEGRPQKGKISYGQDPAVQAVYEKVRAVIPFMEEDREIRPDIEQVEKLVRSEDILNAVKGIVPDFE